MKIYLVHLKEGGREYQRRVARRLIEMQWNDTEMSELKTQWNDTEMSELKTQRNDTEMPELEYGLHGKPYLKGNPWYFNVSHSGEYLLFVQGQYEIGADIQRMRPCDVAKMTGKCCTPQERDWVLSGGTAEEQLRRFYSVWCRKEAYGKFLGCGLTEEVFTKNTQNPLEGIVFLEYDMLEGYHICICCKEEEEREETVHLLEGL